MDKKDYYKTKHWRDFRDNLLGDHNCECELCHRKRWRLVGRGKNKGKYVMEFRGAIHHKHYNTLFKEARSDVMVLCYGCHDLAHSILRRDSSSDYIQRLQDAVREFFTYSKEERA